MTYPKTLYAHKYIKKADYLSDAGGDPYATSDFSTDSYIASNSGQQALPDYARQGGLFNKFLHEADMLSGYVNPWRTAQYQDKIERAYEARGTPWNYITTGDWSTPEARAAHQQDLKQMAGQSANNRAAQFYSIMRNNSPNSAQYIAAERSLRGIRDTQLNRYTGRQAADKLYGETTRAITSPTSMLSPALNSKSVSNSSVVNANQMAMRNFGTASAQQPAPAPAPAPVAPAPVAAAPRPVAPRPVAPAPAPVAQPPKPPVAAVSTQQPMFVQQR